MRVVALVLAAGRGVRLGARTPKGFVRLRGRSLLDWSASALGAAEAVTAVQPVVPPGLEASAELEELARGWRGPARLLDPVAGGEIRQASVAAGLRAARFAVPDADWVVVHDAARCLVEPTDVAAVLAAAAASGAALPIAPATDTVKLVGFDGRVSETLDRARLGLALTPQAFRVEVLAKALDEAERDGFVGTDCASLVEHIGVDVQTCVGRSHNLKVTHARDLAIAEILLAEREGGSLG